MADRSTKMEPRLLGIAPKLFDSRWWILIGVSTATIVSIGVRMNAAKILSLYVPETGVAAEDHHTVFRKPLFFAMTYFLGKLLLLPFVGFPWDWPHHLLFKIFCLVTLGAVGGILEYNALMYLPVSVVVMLRAAGLVGFTALGSAYITQRSTLNAKMGMALLAVVLGVGIASYMHMSDEAGWKVSAVIGIGVVVLSTVSDSIEQLVGEVVLHEQALDVDVLRFTVVCGVFGSCVMCFFMLIAQLLPGEDNGHTEDTVDSLHRLFTSGMSLVFLVIIVLSCLTEMIGASFIMKGYGATTKESVLSFRIVGAWFLACLVYAVAPATGFGEEWETETAELKMVGGAFILAGLLLYVHFRREHEEELGKVPVYEPVD